MRLLFRLLALTTACGTAAAAVGAPGDSTAVVTRGRFRQHVILTCELEAVRSASVTSPRGLAGSSSFTVAELAEEGSRVEEGDVVLRLDSRELAQNRVERETELVDVRVEMESKRLESEARWAELRAELAQAEARLAKARIDASVDPRVTSAAKLQEARHELEIAQVELERQRGALEAAAREQVSDLAILKIREQTALTQLQEADEALQAFEVKATQPGIFVLDEDWSDRKVRVGDSIWAGNTVATIQDLSQMRARCDLDQADGHLVQPGMTA
jgi:multidrug efflux pump subunit AcrA (membrane-fusion protein)